MMLRELEEAKRGYMLVVLEANAKLAEHPQEVIPLLSEFTYVILEEMPHGLPPF